MLSDREEWMGGVDQADDTYNGRIVLLSHL
jgi:hypothetical protein